jgi:hypothetical protein
MEEAEQKPEKTAPSGPSLRTIIRGVIEEFVSAEHTKAEPAFKAELIEERRRREQLEGRLNELVQENQRARQAADEADRNSAIRAELQRLGVAKVDLAYRAVKDDIGRAEDGRLIARNGQGEVGMREFLAQFVTENPELLPARIAGGSGMGSTPKQASNGGAIDLDKIRPGMSPEDSERARREISRIAAQTLRGQ